MSPNKKQTLQDVNVAVGIDEILQQIKEIKKLQESQFVRVSFQDSDARINETYCSRAKYWII